MPSKTTSDTTRASSGLMSRLGGTGWPSSPKFVVIACGLLLACIWGIGLVSAGIEHRDALNRSQSTLDALAQTYVRYAKAIDSLNLDRTADHDLSSNQERDLLNSFRATFRLPNGIEFRLVGAHGVIAGDRNSGNKRNGWLRSRALVPSTAIVAEASISQANALAGWRSTNVTRVVFLTLVSAILVLTALFAQAVARRRDTTIRRWRALFNHPLDRHFVLEENAEDESGRTWRVVEKNLAGTDFLEDMNQGYYGEAFEEHFPPWARDKVSDENALAARQKQSRTYVLVSPDRTQSYAVTAVPVIDDTTPVRHIILRLRDISDREQHDVELETAISAAEAASRAKSAILANTSHELRTPLNAIIGYSEMMQQGIGGSLTARQDEYLQIIHRSGQHLLEIISDILDMAKIESGRFELRDDEIDLVKEIDGCKQLVQQRANDKGVSLRVRAMNAPRLRVDATRIRQILVNLLSNAVKFTDGGSVTVSVNRTDTGGVCIKISDTGIGMSAPELVLALKAFKQVESGKARSQEGTGLGLPLAKKLTMMHGGTFVVKSEKGVGTEVILSFGPERVLADRKVPAAMQT